MPLSRANVATPPGLISRFIYYVIASLSGATALILEFFWFRPPGWCSGSRRGPARLCCRRSWQASPWAPSTVPIPGGAVLGVLGCELVLLPAVHLMDFSQNRTARSEPSFRAPTTPGPKPWPKLAYRWNSTSVPALRSAATGLLHHRWWGNAIVLTDNDKGCGLLEKYSEAEANTRASITMV